ncbi:hypothetical protein PSHT_13011 [Puccinia striiformis]|uniref:EF-hand domain-containing protein n=1 Tax=Puccinia striiformis TaxID=27350 RepID=A0A2S4UT76_9BASI|nr:hypothetical protein PSHT_13011 [Puccinia striiformis]
MIRNIRTQPLLRAGIPRLAINRYHQPLRFHRPVLQARLFHPNRPLKASPNDEPLSASNQLSISRFARARLFLDKHAYLKVLVIGFGSIGVVTASCVVCLLGLLAYDATTYSEKNIERVPVQPLALNPNRGGPKNLKIANYLVGDQDDPEFEKLCDKPKLVIIGGGWGAMGLINLLEPDSYHVVLIAPENYNLFTPLLPSATVGTVETRSLIEPLRKLVARVKGHYLQAYALDVDFGERLVEVKGREPDDEPFYVPYDKLVVSVGSVSNAHGVPGLKYSSQLKTIDDAREIRRKIINNLERASLPSVSEEERRRLLSFVVCGGGPTGVEFASEVGLFFHSRLEKPSQLSQLVSMECSSSSVSVLFGISDVQLYDMIHEDFPRLLTNEVSIHLIQSRDHILNTYSEKISQYAESRFLRAEIDTILSKPHSAHQHNSKAKTNLTLSMTIKSLTPDARVKEITPTSVSYTTKADKDEMHTIPAGFVLWSTGIAMNPLTQKLAGYLPNQYHKHALEVDSYLRVTGAPLGTVYAIGDASTIETNLVNHLLDLVDQCDTNNDGEIDFDEFESMIKHIRRKFPTAQVHIEKVREVFEKYDSDKDNKLGINELVIMFQEISNRLTTLPATAQVADQQGKYLGKKFNKFQTPKALKSIAQNELIDSDFDELLFDPFYYRHLGSLAYIGNSAVFDFGDKYGSFAGGLVAAYLVEFLSNLSS